MCHSNQTHLATSCLRLVSVGSSHVHARTAALRYRQVCYDRPAAFKADVSTETAYRAVSLSSGGDGPACFKVFIHKPQVPGPELIALPQFSCPATGCASKCRTHQQGYMPQR